jgi:hypothetical protein
MERQSDNGTGTPAKQAFAAGNGGVVPPPEHRWKPGQSGNPAGRPRCGAVVRDWLNIFAAQEATATDLEAIVADPSAPVTKVAAARAMLRATTEKGLPDFVAIVEQTDGKPIAPVTGTIELAAIDNRREIFDVRGFAAHIQAFDAHQATEARRLAGNGEQ